MWFVFPLLCKLLLSLFYCWFSSCFFAIGCGSFFLWCVSYCSLCKVWSYEDDMISQLLPPMEDWKSSSVHLWAPYAQRKCLCCVELVKVSRINKPHANLRHEADRLCGYCPFCLCDCLRFRRLKMPKKALLVSDPKKIVYILGQRHYWACSLAFFVCFCV